MRKHIGRPKQQTRKAIRQRLAAARKGKAAQIKDAKARLGADRKAAHGELPQWTTAEIAEAFRRFAAANPAPRGELAYINPFTLLVAVVLSAGFQRPAALDARGSPLLSGGGGRCPLCGNRPG